MKNSLLKLLLRLARCTSGTATLEGVLVLPVAISLMAGGGGVWGVYSVASTADKSMRDAARYLARMPCDGGLAGVCTQAAAICGWGLTNAKNLAVYGNLAGSGNPLIQGWSTSNVTLQQPSDCTALPNPAIIQLTATVPFTSIMLPFATTALRALGIPTSQLPNSITMNVQHQERWIGG